MKRIFYSLFLLFSCYVNCFAGETSINNENTLTLHVATPGTLSDLIFDAGTRPALVAKLILTGTLNDADFTCMRETMTSLIDVDLSGITNTSGVNFNGKARLMRISLPTNLTSIGDMAFMGCSSLVSISIPSSIVSIGAHAFLLTGIYEDQSNWDAGALYVSNCLIAVDPNLVGDYTIRPDTRLIADQALSACNNLTSITIPHSVTCIGSWAFSGHYSTTAVNYAGTKQQWNKISLNTDWNKNSNIQIIHCTDGDFYL